MLSVTSAYQNAIKAPSREFQVELIFNGDETKPITEGINSCSITHYSNSEDSLQLGQFCTSSLNVTFHKDSSIAYNNASVLVRHKLKVGDAYETVTLGTFYITEITKSENSDIMSFVAYDSSQRMNEEYVPTIQYPSTFGEVLDDICKQCNVTNGFIDYSRSDSDKMSQYPINGYVSNITCKEFIQYLASLQGCNARINSEDKLEFYWYKDVDYTIELSDQWQDGFTRSTEDDIVINSLTCVVDNDTTLTSGSGYGITFENPYMTQEQLDKIFTNIIGLTYTPSTITWRGNPSLEICDKVKVIDKNNVLHDILFTETTTYLSGMKAETVVKGATEEEVAMSKSPIEMKINKIYDELTGQFKDATETILGTKGGYFKIDTNEDGLPSGWTIMNTPELRDDTCLWKMTMGGFAFSSDGGKSFTDITIDMLGRINANAITTGVLRGEVFEINLLDGSITMGARNSYGAIDNPWFRVDKSGCHMTAIDTMQESLDAWKTSTEESLDAITKSQIDASANALRIEFNALASNIQSAIDNTNDLLNMFFVFSTDGLQIGKKDSPFKTLFTNEKIGFLQNDTEIAYISNTKLYITTGVFTNQLIVGNEEQGYYIQQLQSDGVLICTYAKTLN